MMQNMAVDNHSSVEVIKLHAHRERLRGITRALVGAVVDEGIVPVSFTEVIIEGSWRSLEQL